LLDSLLQETSAVIRMPGVNIRTDDIVKSQEDKRCYRGLELENGMKVLLISDPSTDKAAAAMDVHIGYMSDPSNLPGLAHFCEHMLFLGTERYPDENEYNKFLSQNGGSSNAFTSTEHTNYYFDIAPDKLEGALDRFSQFFNAPLFTESATDREVKAVNSEHEKNILSDAWRINQLEKATANQEHPFAKFGTGNADTLDKIPKENNVVVRDELLQFYNTWYSSNIMGLSVLGQQDLDTLETMVVGMMSGVQNKQITPPSWPEAPFTEKETKIITYICPVKDIRSLSITWGIPDLSAEYKSCPGFYLGHLIGHEGPGSLLSELKSRGWVDHLVGGQKSGAKGFGFFVVNVDLTKEGIEHVHDIIELVFQYLDMLRREGPQKWVFEECRDLNSMMFRFKDKERPQGYVCGLAGSLHEYSFQEVLSGGCLLSEWKPELVTEILNLLTPDRVRVAITAQQYKDRCNMEEKWYGTKYHTGKIEESLIETWRNCAENPKLRLPDKNEFIPTNFSQVERDTDQTPHPTIIQEDYLGRLWFKQDQEFLLPKTCISIEMRSPVAYCDPHHANLTYMFSMLFKDELNEYVYAAELAGLVYSLANTKSGITLSIKGYCDKQKVLLEKIMEKLTTYKVNEKRFEILRESYTRGLKNFDAEQPHQHAIYYNSVVLSEKIWHKQELLSCLDNLTVEEFRLFIPQLLANLKLECLVYGNSTAQEARQLYNFVSDTLRDKCNTRSLLPSQIMKEREVQLTDPHCIYRTGNSFHKTNGIEVYYQCGVQNTRSNMLLELLTQIIKESCYDQLRTKEQLGYIVFSGIRRSNGVQGLRIIVQSDKQPDFVEERIEVFITSLREKLENMSEEEFSSNKEALASKRLEKPKKLSVKNGRFWSEIISEHLHFNRDEVEVELLRTLTLPEVLAFYAQHIEAKDDTRHKLSCHVVSQATVTQTDAADVGEPIPSATATDTAAEQDESDRLDASDSVTASAAPRILVMDSVTEFKACQPLYPLASAYMKLDSLRRV